MPDLAAAFSMGRFRSFIIDIWNRGARHGRLCRCARNRITLAFLVRGSAHRGLFIILTGIWLVRFIHIV